MRPLTASTVVGTLAYLKKSESSFVSIALTSTIGFSALDYITNPVNVKLRPADGTDSHEADRGRGGQGVVKRLFACPGYPPKLEDNESIRFLQKS